MLFRQRYKNLISVTHLQLYLAVNLGNMPIYTLYFKKNTTVFIFKLLLSLFGMLLLLNTGYKEKNNQLVLLGIFFLMFGIAQFVKKGLQFNVKTLQYRKFHSLFSVKAGKWTACNSVRYIAIYQVTKTKYSFVLRRVPPLKQIAYQLSFFYANENPSIIYIGENYEDVKKAGNKIADFLNLPKLDASPSKHEWVDNF